VSLNDKKTLSMRKLTKLKEIQVDDMETLAKTFSIVATYIVFVEKKSLLNKKFTIIFGLYRGALPNFD
jgi:uncharacterized membrane protein (GlpM family)